MTLPGAYGPPGRYSRIFTQGYSPMLGGPPSAAERTGFTRCKRSGASVSPRSTGVRRSRDRARSPTQATRREASSSPRQVKIANRHLSRKIRIRIPLDPSDLLVKLLHQVDRFVQQSTRRCHTAPSFDNLIQSFPDPRKRYRFRCRNPPSTPKTTRANFTLARSAASRILPHTPA